MLSLSTAQVPSSNDNKFFMKSLCVYKGAEDDKLKNYLKQLKLETSRRLLEILYNPKWGTLDLKFWLQFSKKKFLNMNFS